MERQRTRALSDCIAIKRHVRLSLRSRLAATSLLAVAPFLGYGRQAYAACDPSPSPTFICSGANNTTQLIDANNANVSTVDGFSVNAPSGNGIYITGDGHLRFTDTHGSTVNAPQGVGLYVDSYDNGSTGGITIQTNGNFTAGTDGIRAFNEGDGNISITTDGDVTGGEDGVSAKLNGAGNIIITANGEVHGDGDQGIYAGNTTDGRNVTITTGADSVISGDNFGIYANNYGTGDLRITANGQVGSLNQDAIYGWAGPGSGDINITTGADSVVEGGTRGIYAYNGGLGDVVVDAGGEVSGGTDGIYVKNGGLGDLAITTGAQSIIYGADNGIVAYNDGKGDLNVTVRGSVGAGELDGIRADNYENGGNLTITTAAGSEVSGVDDGIQATNIGHGNLTITVNGAVTGKEAFGIQARNTYGEEYNPYNQETYHFYGVDLNITTGAASKVYGKNTGIFAVNNGSGNLAVTINGDVTGDEYDGLYALNGGANLFVTTGANSHTVGQRYGIYAKNYNGDLKVTVNGQVEGKDEDGIKAYNYGDGLNLTVVAGAGSKVTGDEYGIYTRQGGTGDLTLTIDGEVTGTNRDGVEAINSDGNGLKITTGAQSIITGGEHGIYVDNHGYGDAEITAKGKVTGLDGDGIHASNSSTSDNQKGLKITTTAGSSVTGSQNGIYGDNFGDLDLAITVNGVATGEGDNGIYASNAGDGDTVIKVGATGLVQGNDAGIEVKSGFLNDGQDIFITNDGVVRNLSSEPVDRAITTRDGPTRIDNNGQLVGTVFTDQFADTLNNNGLWNVAGGTSDFGDETDVVNNHGTLVAARDATGAGEITVVNGLETFNNAGLVTLADGGLGDELQLNGPVAYVGQGGTLAVDVVLAPGGEADLLRIDGSTSGVTYVAINVANPASIMPNTDGIAVAVVSGATANGDFDAEGGVINAGFFAWDVRLDEDDHTHELYTTGLGAGAYEFAAGVTGAQDLWYQTNGTVLQRQADLRPLLEGMGVTPVADFSEPLAPTPVAKVTPGFWFRGVGAYSERDDEENGVTLDRKQATYGGLAGFDFGTQDVGDALMFGVFGGYIFSDLDFDQTNTEWQFEGPTVGVYATYLDRALHLDATVKADFLDIDIDADDIAPGAGTADTDAFNIGGQIDLGYKIGLGHGLFVDPQASVAVVHTEIDDIDDIFGGAVEFDDATSVRGRLGARLGHETTTNDGTLYSGDVTASVWQEFAGDNEATVFAPLTPATDVSDDPGETYGDVSVGFSVLSPEGWSGFIRANYLFAEDYDAIAGNAGLRYAW